MKRLIFSDTHFHPFSYGSFITEEGFNSRLIAQYNSAMEMVRDAVENRIKYVYFCGDLFHQHGNISSQALFIASKIFTQLRKCGIKIRAITGNHDQFNRSGSIHSLSWLQENEINGNWEDDGLLVSGYSYTNNEDELKQFLGNTKGDERRMVLLHQGVFGVPLSSGHVINEVLSSDMIPENVQAFTGHYHAFNVISKNLVVVGNLTPLNWGDLNQQKGWLIWDDETGKLERKYQTKSPNFLSWAGESDIELRGNFIRYTKSIKVKEQIDIRNQLLEKGALSVEFPSVKLEKKQDNIKLGNEINLNNLIQFFDDKNKGRRKEVGTEIREEKYNIKE